jgi:hypothetical protein
MSNNLPSWQEYQRREDASLFSGLPSFPAAGTTELVCNECGQPNPGTASYSVLHIIFLLVVVVWRIDPVFKCPGCMRAYLLQRLPLGLLLATVFAPLVLVWWGVLFVRTFGR